ncbi:MAG: hypothetical protein JW902_03505 [Syntrophaceae bacterium]|nr:hypothetical protein [Syntrophaceae bacterium]
MGYFDGLTDASFKTDEKGNTIFYPWGILGRGYILPEDKKDSFRNGIKRFLQISLPLVILITVLKLWLLLLIVLPVFIIGYTIWIKKITKNLNSSSNKLTLSESTINSARSHNLTTLWFLAIGSLLFVVASIFIIIIAPEKWTIGLPGVIFFGFGLYVFWKMIKAKRGTK